MAAFDVFSAFPMAPDVCFTFNASQIPSALGLGHIPKSTTFDWWPSTPSSKLAGARVGSPTLADDSMCLRARQPDDAVDRVCREP